ncbi:MAG: hypothetical protein EOP34_02350 [Rickettsiales bacterium]|nr:MAG: hypothetical protein EOP34_02350 [Rickettsiales bacterium]
MRHYLNIKKRDEPISTSQVLDRVGVSWHLKVIITLLLISGLVLISDASSKQNSHRLLTETDAKCLHPAEGPENYEHYIGLVTVVKNKRRYIRQWLEFYIMTGITYFMFYDNGSEDGLKEVLQPYIDDGIVFYIKWPPSRPYKEDWTGAEALEAEFNDWIEDCYKQDELAYFRVYPCAITANNDAARRSRGKVRWLAAVDVDEYIYLSQSSLDSPNLVEAFKKCETNVMVSVYGYHYGTGGWIVPPRREGDDQAYPTLLIKSHPYHLPPAVPYLNIGQNRKSFVNPYCALGNGVHYWAVPEELQSKIRIFVSHPIYLNSDGLMMFLNHYVWLSREDAYEKAVSTKWRYTAYARHSDRYMTADSITAISYLIPKLEKSMEESIMNRAPRDGHADDWDFTLTAKHKRIGDGSGGVVDNLGANKTVDLCVVVTSPRHIGLVRHALTSIIYYFYKIEPTLNYKLIVSDVIDPKLKKELESDFPIDAFASKEEDDFCGNTLYYLMLKEYSFARWSGWPTSKPAIKMAMQILANDDKVSGIYFGDSFNSMSKWNMLNNNITDPNDLSINYRPISSLSKEMPNAMMFRRGRYNDDLSSIYELCLDTVNDCKDNALKGLFDRYYQQRMYGLPPPQLVSNL